MVQAKKRFGQNFLINQNIITQIIESIAPQPDQLLIEIGPGLGALTKPLLSKNFLLAIIEIDRDLLAKWEIWQKNYSQLTIYAQDALKFNFKNLLTSQESYLRIFGNLPYNISSPLLLHCFEYIDNIQDMHFMLQKEVVERLQASPGNKNYGRLSIITQYFCEVVFLFDVPPNSFQPAPKVDSAFFRLIPKKNRPRISIKNLEAITRAAFSQRRKKISNNLSKFFSKEQLMSFGIDPNDRAENISVETYCALALSHTPCFS